MIGIMNKSKKLHMFYLFPVLYVASVYLFPVFFILSEKLPFFSYFAYAPLVFGIINIIASVKFCKPECLHIMLNSAVLVKYILIPFFLIGGFIVAVFLLSSIIPVPFMIFFGPFMAFIICLIGWVVLAFSAPYTISYLRLSQKAGTRPVFLAVIHALLQFFFFLDVFDVMYLTLKEGKWKKLTITLLSLMAITLIGFFIFVFSAIVRTIF